MRVPTTKKLWDEIQGNITKMFQRRFSEEITLPKFELTAEFISSEVYRLFFSEIEEELMGKLGARFFTRWDNEAKSVELPVFQPHLDTETEPPPRKERKKYKIVVEIKIKGRYVPKDWSTYSTPAIKEYVEGTSVLEKAQTYYDARSRLSEEQTNFIAAIKSLYESVPTVNQFLKEWPAGEEFLPRETIDKVNAKLAKREKAEAVLDEDSRTNLNASLLRAKILK